MENTTYGGEFAPTAWMHALPATHLDGVMIAGAMQRTTGGELRPAGVMVAPMTSEQGITLPAATQDLATVKVRFVPSTQGSHAFEPSG